MVTRPSGAQRGIIINAVVSPSHYPPIILSSPRMGPIHWGAGHTMLNWASSRLCCLSIGHRPHRHWDSSTQWRSFSFLDTSTYTCSSKHKSSMCWQYVDPSTEAQRAAVHTTKLALKLSLFVKRSSVGHANTKGRTQHNEEVWQFSGLHPCYCCLIQQPSPLCV